MSTRATIHFTYAKGQKPEAIIYRHSDGYPEGLGEDLHSFIEEVKKNVQDTRFTDPSYLAAKWVVWDASRHTEYANGPKHPLNFLGVGVVQEDPGDIEFRYTVICDGTMTVICDPA